MKSHQTDQISHAVPLNNSQPLRFAFLGAAKAGKTALISKITTQTYRDTYYPLRQTAPIMFRYCSDRVEPNLLLDESLTKTTLRWCAQHEQNLLLSPVVSQALVRNLERPSTEAKAKQVYNCVQQSGGYRRATPILTELIDTPAFNPDQIVPFLEASLHIELSRDVLHNLADTPRRPVSTNPLLVASGAGELNGAIHGYFFVYSAVPSVEPPGYEQSELAPHSSGESHDLVNSDGTARALTFLTNANDTTFSVLPVIKNALDEAWKEYFTWKSRWENGQESDVFLLKSLVKSMWSEKVEQDRQAKAKLLDTLMDPADPRSPPPIWIVCTHLNLRLASPKLLADGKRLARLWRCGFVGVDVEENVDEVVALMVREVVERQALKKARKTQQRR